MGFPSSSVGKESACNARDPGSTPGLGRSPGEGNGNPLQYSCLEISMDRGAWQTTVHGIAKSQTWLCDYVHVHVHAWKEIFMFTGNLVSYKACHMAQPGKSSIENLFAQVKWPDSIFAEEIVVVQSLSCIRLFATPCTAAHQASLSFTISWSLLRLMSIELMIPSNHLIFCCPLLLLSSIFPSIRVFTNELTLHIRWPKYWSFNINPSNEYSGWFPLRLTDLFSLLAKELSRVFLSTTVRKCQFFGAGPIWFHLAWHLFHNPFPILSFINSDNTCLLNTYYVKGSVSRAGCMQCGGIAWPATVSNSNLSNFSPKE